jgi:hypothetical protein
MAQRTVRILDADGVESWMKKKRVDALYAKGAGEFRVVNWGRHSHGQIVFCFHRAARPAQAGISLHHGPSLADRLAMLPAWPDTGGAGYRNLGHGEGLEGFLTYPQPSMLSNGERLPGIAAWGRE